MTVSELLDPLDKLNIDHIKICTGQSLHVFDLNEAPCDSLAKLHTWFGKCRVKEWRADVGYSIYIEI
jgi:hypothetical protein